MQRELRIAWMVAAGSAVALIGTLYAAFGWVDAAVLTAIVAALGGLYRVRPSARPALVYDSNPSLGIGGMKP